VTRCQSLGHQQAAFIDLLLDDSLATPGGWDSAGFSIYRNAYRARIVEAVRDTYPRTERWIGEDAFRRAAIHHVISHPPNSWTLDAVGVGFPTTLAELFSRDPEVRELAWLEWAMHTCFVSADAEALDATAFTSATAAYSENDWETLRLRFVPGTQVAAVQNDLSRLWTHLTDTSDSAQTPIGDITSTVPGTCVVWRQGLRPVFALVDAKEGMTLECLLAGDTYGEACAKLAELIGGDAAVTEAGAMLGRWIHQGMVAGVDSREQRRSVAAHARDLPRNTGAALTSSEP
jgi:hypothetical protein